MISLQDEFLICNTGWVLPSFGGWYSFFMRTCWLVGSWWWKSVWSSTTADISFVYTFLRYQNPCRFKSHWLVSFIPLPLGVFPFLFSRNKYDPVTIPASVCFWHSYHHETGDIESAKGAGSLGHRFAGDQPCILDANWETWQILQFQPRYPSNVRKYQLPTENLNTTQDI